MNSYLKKKIILPYIQMYYWANVILIFFLSVSAINGQELEIMSVKNKKANIYTIFGRAFQKDANEILDKLKTKCIDVNFIGKDVTSTIKPILEKIKTQKNDLDGILVFGIYYDHELTSIELPVIMVRGLLYWGENWDRGILNFYKGEKILDAQLCKNDISTAVSTARFNDLVEKIELITALKKVKESRLLDITYHAGEPGSGPCFHDGGTKPNDYEDIFFIKLKKIFGLDIKAIDYKELNSTIEKVEKKEAEKIADMWIREAKEIREDETNRSEVIKSAKMYLAIVELMKKYNCNAMTMASWGFFRGWGELAGKGVTDAMPPLAEMELAKQLKVTSCETLIDCIVTQMVGLHSTGRPSFVGDALGFDILNELAIFGHCYAPINPYGDETRIPYIIRSHATTHQTGEHTAVGIQLEFPINEIITAVKISVYDEKISLFTGRTVDSKKYFKGFDDIMCRTKLVAKIDSEHVLKNLDNDTFGHHYAIFFGDWRKKFRQLGTLLGFEVLEEDKQMTI
jgi:hypothetical protein